MKFQLVKNGEVVAEREWGDGQYKFGRASHCDLQIASQGVSKEHGLVVVQGKKAAIVDTGSSNGIFINGVMIRKERLRKGDEARVGEYVLRLAKGAQRKDPHQTPSSSLEAGDSLGLGGLEMPAAGGIGFGGGAGTAAELEPTAQDKVLNLVEQKILHPLYGLMEKFDWRILLSSLLVTSLVMTVLLSVVPILRWGKNIALRESLSRAHTVIAQIVRENHRVLSQTNDYTRMSVEAAEKEPGILDAWVVDPKANTIYAPTKLYNKSIEDIYYLLAIKNMVEDDLDIISLKNKAGNYIVAQPIRLYSAQQKDKEMVAIAIAEFRVPDSVYATYEPMIEAALFSVLIALIAYFLIYKLVTHPILKMEEDLDKALKGDKIDYRCQSKVPELQSLAHAISSLISRYMAYENSDQKSLDVVDDTVEDDIFINTMRGLDAGVSDAVLILNESKQVQFVGGNMEQLLDIKASIVRGKNITEAIKEGGIAGAIIEMCERVTSNFGAPEFGRTDIHGISRDLSVLGHKNSSGELRFLVVMVKLSESE